jgi:PAS domain S-box-containing protein
VAQSAEFTIFEELPEGCTDEICFLEQEKLVSLAYIPISTKERSTFGVIRIGSRQPKHFSQANRHVLELIGNRIGVAIENAMLQEQYIKSEEKYRTLFNSDPHPIFILDSHNFSILDTNQRAQDSYGYSRQELLGRKFLELGDESDEELADGLKNLSRDHSMLFTKCRHYRKGGQPFFVNVNISQAKYGESDVVIASTTDITESVDKETQLIQASKMTTLGQMAAGIAHEINQPLNVIQVCADYFAKMIERGQAIAEEDLVSMTRDITSNVQRASGIIQHMRDFSRQSEVTRSKVCINDPIRDVFKVLGHQLKIHEVQLQLDLDPDIPFIMADHNRLEQVFINLVTNALDAMDEKRSLPEHKKAEKLLTIRSFTEDGKVVVTVTDTGVGMSAEVIAKLFEPFFTTKKVGKGTGLGVSISYGIVRDYDGVIDITSSVGEGTTFTLRFPGVRSNSKKTTP